MSFSPCCVTAPCVIVCDNYKVVNIILKVRCVRFDKPTEPPSSSFINPKNDFSCIRGSTYMFLVMSTQVSIWKKVIYVLTQRHQPHWACVAVTEPARPPAWRQLGSGFYGRRPPWKALIDWRLIFLTGWNPATKTMEQRRGWGGAKMLLYDRERERETRHKCSQKRKKSVFFHVCQMTQIIWL